MIKITRNDIIVTHIVFAFAVIMVSISLISVIFPALISSHYGSISTGIEPFTIGNNAALLIASNIVLFSLGYVYYKKKSGTFSTLIDKVRNFEISKKVSIIASLIILIVYISFTVSELSIDESEQFPDYVVLKIGLETFPETSSGDMIVDEQNSRFVRMILLGFSQEYLQNIKIIPFVTSIVLVLVTGLVAVSISGKRIAGIIAIIVLLQGYTFLEYDTIAVYENLWVLFFLLSVYAIHKRWYLSGFWYILSVFTKAFATPFLALNVFYALRSEHTRSFKTKILLSYLLSALIVIGLFYAGNAIYDDIVQFDFNRFANSLSDFSSQMRFDYFLLATILPVTFGLFFIARNGLKQADSLLFFITGLLLAGPLVAFATEFYVILPYRFVPLLVFFSISVGLVIFKTSKSSLKSQQ